MAKAAKSNSEGQEAKKDPLQLAMEKIEKDYGKGTMVGDKHEKLDIISSGSLKLDIADGIGGYARGKLHEFMGWESCGKTTYAYHAIAEAQKLGLKALLIDGEYGFDPEYATKIGVDVDNMDIYQPDGGGGEKAYDITERLMKTGAYGIVVIDSQTALLPKKMIDDPAGSSHLGLHARLMSLVIPKLMILADNYNVCLIVISQFREKIGVMFGSPETTNGGNALKMYSHMRLTFRKSILSDGDKNAYANKTSVKISKNKLGIPYRTVETNIVYGEGIDKVYELFDVACELDIITKAGSWYSYKGTQLGQGEDKVIQLLRDNEPYAIALKKRIDERLKEMKDEKSNSGGNGPNVGQDREGATYDNPTQNPQIPLQTSTDRVNGGNMESIISPINTNSTSITENSQGLTRRDIEVNED